MLGKVEELILLSLLKVGPDAMAAKVFEHIADNSAANLAFGTVFTTLDRLVEKGLAIRAIAAPTAESRGRTRSVYKISASGGTALSNSLKVTASLVGNLELNLA